MSEQVFRQLLADSGMPTTDAALKQEFRQIADAEGVTLNNDSEYSPFWRLITAIVITPVLWLQELLVTGLMPNMFVRYAVDAFLDLLGDAVDLTRKEAVLTKGMLTFERDNTASPLIIPADTWIETVPISGTVYRVRVTADTAFPNGATSVQVPVEAEYAGVAYNLAAGYLTITPVPVAGVVRVFNAEGWISQPGADRESNDDFRGRIRNQFSAVNQYHTDAVYRSMIAAQTGFATDRIFFEHDAPRGPGTANAFVLFDAGVPSAGYLTQVNDYISVQGNHGHGDDLQIFAMPETWHDLAVTVYVPTWLDASRRDELASDIELYIRSAFREAVPANWQPTLTWPWKRFSFSRLGEELHALFDDEIDSLAWNLVDIVSEMEIPRLQSLTLTLEDAE